MSNKSNSHLARYAVVSLIGGDPYQIAWFVTRPDAKDFIKALNGDPNYYSIEEVD